jgi:hypothetical protein
VKDEAAEYHPQNPWGNDVPFSTADLYDVALGEDNNSRVAEILTGRDVSPDQFPFFTTYSPTTIRAGRAIRGQKAWGTTSLQIDDSGTEDPPIELSDHDYMGGETYRRAVQNALSVGGSSAEKKGAAKDLGAFIWNLGPVITDENEGDIVTDHPEIAQSIAYQAAVNLVDMVDTDEESTHFPMDFGSGARIFRGVEVRPYLAEVEAVIRTSNVAYLPPNTGTVTTTNTRSRQSTADTSRQAPAVYRDIDGDGVYSSGDEVWLDRNEDGVYNAATESGFQIYDGGDGNWDTNDGDPGTTKWTDNNPPTGWGKYIKLVNPWNVSIQLDDADHPYRLHFPQSGQGWEFTGSPPTWQQADRTIGTGGYIELTGTIPARGHFLVFDNETACESQYLPKAENRMKEVTLTYLRPTQTIQLQRKDNSGNWQVVMETTYPIWDDGTNSEPNDDDSLGGATPPTGYAPQISDPRPCWWRVDRNGDGTQAQSEPWGTDAWNTELMKSAEFEAASQHYEFSDSDTDGDTRDIGIFNLSWTLSPTKTGDRWLGIQGMGPNLPSNTEDHLLVSFPPKSVDSDSDGHIDMDRYEARYNPGGGQDRAMDLGLLPGPGHLGFVHSGVEWGTLSLTSDPPGDDGAGSSYGVVYLRNLTDYMIGPVSPLENGQDDDNDGTPDDDGNQAGDRLGPENRLYGRINVNTARTQVLQGALKYACVKALWTSPDTRAEDIVQAIVDERTDYGPFSSVDDLFQRVPEIFQIGDGGGDSASDVPNSHRSESLARFMYNNLTVRTDCWGAVARVRIWQDQNDDGVCQDGEVLGDKIQHFILDRSVDPVRVMMRREVDVD